MIRIARFFAGGPRDAGDALDDYYSASQWKLILLRLSKHRLAQVSFVVLGILYLQALFAQFIAPQGLTTYNSVYVNCPPSRIRFIDAEGRFHLRPFVHALESSRDPETLRKTFVEDRSVRYPLRLFHHGEPYRLWGFIETDLHLFGVDEPGAFFLFGTDSLGRDLFSRIVHGSLFSLTIPFAGVLISFLLGIVIGGISGYFGGIIDTIIQRLIEIIRSFPTLPLWMALSAAIPPNIPLVRMYFYITIILSVIGWTGLARVVRSRFLSLRTEDFVMAARVAGAGTMRTLFVHMIPNFMSYLIVHMTLAVPEMIIGETAMSFLGLGIRSPATSWGVLLQEAQRIQNVALYPWRLIPLVYVVVTVLAFNFLGDGLRDAADPYKQASR